jgi:hypothetical protein
MGELEDKSFLWQFVIDLRVVYQLGLSILDRITDTVEMPQNVVSVPQIAYSTGSSRLKEGGDRSGLPDPGELHHVVPEEGCIEDSAMNSPFVCEATLIFDCQGSADTTCIGLCGLLQRPLFSVEAPAFSFRGFCHVGLCANVLGRSQRSAEVVANWKKLENGQGDK